MYKMVLEMAGAVALLLWGTYMVKTGILRTFGDSLREFLSTRLTNRAGGFLAGTGLAVLLQSSTASALLVAGLQGKGLVSTVVALACVLGADLGSAFVVRLFSFDLTLFIPMLILVGVILFLSRTDQSIGQFGRILLGLAFVMAAITAIGTASAPLRGDEAAEFLSLLSQQKILCVGIGAVLALTCFSSLAAVMIVAGAAASGHFEVSGALWAVLGANVGSAALAVISTWKASDIARRAPWGNALFRLLGFGLGSVFLLVWPSLTTFFAQLPGGVVYFHLAFNAVTGLLGLTLLTPVARLIEWLLPNRAKVPDTAVGLIGAEDMLTSDMVLSELRRETAKSAHLLAGCWQESAGLLAANLPAGKILELRSRFATVRKRGKTIELYLDALVRRGLTVADAQLWKLLDEANDVLSLAARVADKMLGSINRHKCAHNLFFSPEGVTELTLAHGWVQAQMERFGRFLAAPGEDSAALADAIVQAQADDAARNFALIAEHMQRVASGRTPSVDTSALHVDLLSTFRRIEGILTTAVRNAAAA